MGQSAGILVVISVALLAAWNAVYFTLLYGHDNVTTGNDGIGFITVTVKQQVVFSLWIACVVCAFFAYYLCVLSQYKNLYREAAVKKWIEENPDEEEKPLTGLPSLYIWPTESKPRESYLKYATRSRLGSL